MDRKPGAFHWANANNTLNKAEIFNETNGCSNGYGVSTGVNSSIWWNRPRDARLPAFICQKTVLNWRQELHLHLEQSAPREMAITFSYTPQPITSLGVKKDVGDVDILDVVAPPLLRRKWFWLPEFDVVCTLASHVIRFSLPAAYQRRYRTTVVIPASASWGLLSCEGWINRPVFRFRSNSIVYRPPDAYVYVVRTESARKLRQQNLVDDLVFILSDSSVVRRVLRPLVDWQSVTAVVDAYSTPQVMRLYK